MAKAAKAERETLEIVMEEFGLLEIKEIEDEFDMAFAEFIEVFFSKKRRAEHIGFLHWLITKRKDAAATLDVSMGKKLGEIRFKWRDDDELGPTNEPNDAGEVGSTS